MSLIFQALRRLGSETEEVPLGGSAPRTPETRPAVRAARPGVWWLLAIVLGLATIPLALQQDLPARAMSVLAGSGEWLRGPGPVSSVAATVVEGDHEVAGEPSTADGAVPVKKAPPAVVVASVQKQIEPAVAEAQRGPRLDTRTAPVTISTLVDPGPGADKPRAVSAKPTANARSPQEDDGVVTVTQAKFGESLTVVSDPAARSGGPAENVKKENNTKRLVATREKSPASSRALKVQARRERQRTRARGKSLHISRLTADLTRAVRADDQIKIRRILDELGSKAGADNSYVLNMRAYVALAHGQYTEVESLLGRVLARDATDVNAGLNMAVAESRTGRIQEARQRLEDLASPILTTRG